MIKNASISAILIAAFLTATACAAGFPNPQIVLPEGTPPIHEADYFADHHGNPCDFNVEGDHERIVEFGLGIKNKKVADGSLKFTTSEKGNFFCFGRWFYPAGPEDIPDENIGADWPVYATPHIRMRVKQSLPSSTWSIKCRYPGKGTDPGKTGGVRFKSGKHRKLRIEGTGWQELVMPFTLAQSSYRCLYFETKEKDNTISIDYIKVANLRTPVYYRKKILLDDDPVHARIRVGFDAEHHIYVNGKLAHYNHGLYQKAFNPAVDITTFLRKGENTIAVGSDNCIHHMASSGAYKLVCKGTALTKKGSFVSLNSDKEWKASFALDDKWFDGSYDDTVWKPVIVESAGSIRSGPATYVGPLQVVPEGDPIFKLKEGISISVVLPKGYRVAYSLTDSFAKEGADKGQLTLKSLSSDLDSHALSYQSDQPGVWDLKLELLDQEEKTVAERALEVAVVGTIPQKKVKGTSFTEGMELTKVADIDCTDDSEHKPFSFGNDKGSAVVKTAFGNYRESEGNAWAGFGYIFTVENLYKPHIIEVEYPDDKEREIMAKVFCSRNKAALATPGKHKWHWYSESRWHSGTRTGGYEFPVSNTMKKFHLLFWPNGQRTINCIQIMSTRGGLGAAARSIKVYEIDDLPALDLPDTPDRLFGMYVERENIAPLTFYSGRYYENFTASAGYRYTDRMGRVRDWYDTISNMIKYLRFSGQNLYVPGYYMYTGGYLPETAGRSRYGGRKPTDHFRLMASMFEENGLYLLLGCEYGSSRPVRENANHTNWEVQHEGADTLLAVSKTGRQSSYGLSALPFVMDYQHPVVEEDIMSILRKYLEYGADYKSFKGLSFNTRNVSFPCLPQAHLGKDLNASLDWGWQDSAIALFEKETGISVPVPQDDPKRFNKRYEYVMSHPKIWDKWMDFRCNRLHDQVARLARYVQDIRPDCSVYINQVGPAPDDSGAISQGQLRFDEAMRRRGFDKALYKEDGIVHVPELGRDGRGMFHTTSAARQRRDYWRGADGFYLSRPGAPHTQDVVTADPYAHWAYTIGMTYLTPSVIVFSQADVQLTSGGEQRFRPFLRAFRSLPKGAYKTLAGNGLDDHVVIRALQDSRENWFYMANPYRYAINTTLEFSRRARFKDVLDGTPVSIKGNKATFLLKPYEIRVFAGKGSLMSGHTKGDDNVRRFVVDKLPHLNLLLGIDVVKTKELVTNWDIGLTYKRAMEYLSEILEAHNTGDLLKALELCDLPVVRNLVKHAVIYGNVKEPPAPKKEYRITCGADTPYKGTQGRTWLADKSYIFGVDSYGHVGRESGHVYRKDVDIKGTEDDDLYRSERYGMRGYKFLVPDGQYTVKLHFAEGFSGARKMTSKRIMDIVIEGNEVNRNFEILGETRYQTALVKTFTDVKVLDGELAIELPKRAVCSSSLNAIEVIQQD